jgi:hypothetical protein
MGGGTSEPRRGAVWRAKGTGRDGAMGGPLHPASPGGASFELERLELERGRLVISGWWFGVRGLRFVRPALVVKGRQVLATLEHKPWATGSDGAWTAAFPWKEGTDLDVAAVTLVVAPSVEVPLDRDAVDAEVPPSPSQRAGPAELPDMRQPLRDELHALDRQLAELRQALAAAAEQEVRRRQSEEAAAVAEREARGRQSEQAATAERAAADQVRTAGDDLARAHAMAVLDRDRAHAQREEAVVDREAAVRARSRMEAQRDEALAQREAADARLDEAIAQRDDARRQRDEILLAHRAPQGQRESEWTQGGRTQPLPVMDAQPESGDELTQPLAVGDAPPRAGEGLTQPLPVVGAPPRADGGLTQPWSATEPLRPIRRARAASPIGARTAPAVRAAVAYLRRAEHAREQGVTKLDLWAVGILGVVGVLSFIWLLLLILKAVFVF